MGQPPMALQVDNNFGDDSSVLAANDCLCCNLRSGHASEGKTLYDGTKIQRHSLICSMVQAHACPCCALAQNSERMGITNILLKRTAIVSISVVCIVLMVVGGILKGVGDAQCAREFPSTQPSTQMTSLNPKCTAFA